MDTQTRIPTTGSGALARWLILAPCAGGALWLILGMPAGARPPSEEVDYLLAGMRHERSKLYSGSCRMEGRLIGTNAGEPEPVFDGPLTIFVAFEGNVKVRFDQTQPGWVADPTTGKPDPLNPGQVIGLTSRKGTLRCHFYDNGKKAAYWEDDSGPTLTVMPSYGGEIPYRRLEFFDVRALGFYDVSAMERRYKLPKLLEVWNTLPQRVWVDRTDPTRWVLGFDARPETPYQARVWIDVGRGFTPIHYLVRERPPKSPDSAWTTTFESETGWEEREGVWVPVRHRYLWTTMAQPQGWRRQVEFRIAWDSINKDVDPKLFDWEDFGLPPNAGVYDASQSGRIITIREYRPAPAPVQSSRRGTYLIIAAGVSSVLLILVGALVLHRRRQRRNVVGAS